MQLVEHDDGGAPVVVDQPPEVGGGALQRVEGHDEGRAPGIALQGNWDSAPNTAKLLPHVLPPCPPQLHPTGPGCLQGPSVEVGWHRGA